MQSGGIDRDLHIGISDRNFYFSPRHTRQTESRKTTAPALIARLTRVWISAETLVAGFLRSRLASTRLSSMSAWVMMSFLPRLLFATQTLVNRAIFTGIKIFQFTGPVQATPTVVFPTSLAVSGRNISKGCSHLTRRKRRSILPIMTSIFGLSADLVFCSRNFFAASEICGSGWSSLAPAAIECNEIIARMKGPKWHPIPFGEYSVTL